MMCRHASVQDPEEGLRAEFTAVPGCGVEVADGSDVDEVAAPCAAMARTCSTSPSTSFVLAATMVGNLSGAKGWGASRVSQLGQ